MSDLLAVPLKLRRDAIYLKTEKGIVFRSRKGAFEMRGSTVYSTFQQLVPYLDGSTRGWDLVASLREDGRRSVSDLLQVLVQRDVLQIADDADTLALDSAVARAFESQIEFIRHCADRPHTRFRNFRSKRLLLAGDGTGFLSAGAALLRNGLRTLHVSTHRDTSLELMERECSRLRQQDVESELYRFEPSEYARHCDFEFVIYCSERPDLSEIRRLNIEAFEFGYQFLPAMIHAGSIFVGPAVDPLKPPSKPACWECAMLRWSDNAPEAASSEFWKRIALRHRGDAHSGHIAELSAHMLGNTAALEVFKWCAGPPESETQSKLLKQDLSTMEAGVKNVLAHPECGACSQVQHRWKRAILARAANISVRDCLLQWSELMDEDLGVFSGFNDEDIEQIPLRLSVLDFGRPSGSSAVGWSLENSDAARFHALIKGIALKTFESAPATLSRRIVGPLHERQTADPSRIAGWLGNSEPGAVCQSYFELTDLRTSEPVLVPAGAVHPHFDREGWFDRNASGIGVGLDKASATRSAVLSLYEQIIISSLAHGTLAARHWRYPDRTPDDTTVYLLATSYELGLSSVDVVVAPSADNGVYTAIVLPETKTRLRFDETIVATDFSPAKAVHGALTENLARTQMRRGGREWRDVRMPRGLYSSVECSLKVDGEIDLRGEANEDGLARLLDVSAAEGKTIVVMDLTPPEIQMTGTLRVVKALLLSEDHA